MTIDLSVEEVRFLQHALQMANELSQKMSMLDREGMELARKATAVSNNILRKLEQSNPENS